METYNTEYGEITLSKNDKFIAAKFRDGNYWGKDTLHKLQQYIDPAKNILEIGGHCGTSTVVYASYLNENAKVFVYEPQKKLYKLLLQNINQNKLQTKIVPFQLGVFCYKGIGQMNSVDIDGGGGEVLKRYNDNMQCNFGGIGLGDDGETINLTTIDKMGLENLGYIHCDAQGAENYIFSNAVNTITKYRPVILYENNQENDKPLYDNVFSTYPEYEEESKFDIRSFCMNKLNYSSCIDKFNDSHDTLLIP